MSDSFIEVYGAREHNLQDIDVKIPRNQLVVITGLSGSGKSSLAFDTIYAEGQRRYIETFSAYARQFLGGLERPDVDKIEGLSPVIAIEQKTTSKNPRSTIGTITEIYDFLRLLYARVATAYSYSTGEPMVQYTDNQIKELIKTEFKDRKIAILAPLVRSRKGNYKELFLRIAKYGFLEVRVNGEIQEIKRGMKLDRYKTHDIEVLIDKLILKENTDDQRLHKSIETAMKHGQGIIQVYDYEKHEARYFSRQLMCPTTGISYPNPEPNTFSFNSPKGACPKCDGLGKVRVLREDKIIPNPKLSISQGAIAPFEDVKVSSRVKSQIESILAKYNTTDKTPWDELPEQAKQDILHGTKETVSVQLKYADISKTYTIDFEGVNSCLETLMNLQTSASGRAIRRNYSSLETCPECKGKRLRMESLHFRIADKDIGEVSSMDMLKLQKFVGEIPSFLNEKQNTIAAEILKELNTRIQFLLEVGLNYMSLNRESKSLSGGEAQRIRLATQIGSQLVNVLYILDEPSIGLHQRDNTRLIQSLQNLRDIGNSVLVVEHDKEMIEKSDYLIDMGPAAGKKGGHVIWNGEPKDIKKSKGETADYLNGKKKIELPKNRRKGNGSFLELKGASGNNLKKVNLKIPLGTLTVISGVSGSGKSTLINETLYRILNQHFYKAVKDPLPYKSIHGLEHLDKVIEVNQSPIGRTPRSNPATYTGVFTPIRDLFAALPEAKIRGYKPGRFSFNVKGGRCETCQGSGLRVIEMNFLPDIYVHCETCQGRRFNRETLEVRYKGKSIADVLEMTVNEAVEFFEPVPKIYQVMKMLQEVGLGYISVGQQSTTLSGGEAQRVKLATELAKRQTGKTVYILDEPTTGLHFEDIRVLMEVIQKLVNFGNTVIIIEHNLDVIKLADYVIDLGPEGGEAGGQIIAKGTPEEVAKSRKSYTAKYLKEELKAK